MSLKQPRKKYTKEFKLDVITRSYRVDNIQELARELGLRVSLIYKWRAAYTDSPETAFPGNGVQALSEEQRELHQLKLENAELRMERDILKKAIGIFGKTNG
tara:strand:- start:92 stop:397 length:306 start_codon:yes stop_codon:yes gene_type:complete